MYEIFEQLVQKSNKSVYQISKETGIRQQFFSDWKLGKAKKIGTDKLQILADYFGVSISYLLTGVADENSVQNVFPYETKKVPLLGQIACGQPIFAEEIKGEYVSVAADMDVDFCLQAKGDSMINARIHNGDIVFCRSTPTVDNGRIAAVLVDGDEATLKRIYFYPEKQKLLLVPENPAYEPLVFIGDEITSIRILGEAVAFQSVVR